MLDSYNNQKFNFDINAVSGTIRKSHPKSIICKTRENPYLLDMDNPRTTASYYNSGYCEVVVLQVMIIKDGFIVEFVKKEDFEEVSEDVK